MSVPVFDLSKDLSGSRVLLRASLNVPVDQGKVTNAFRLEQALPTIESLAKRGARVVVLAHIGREKTNSLRPVYEELKTRTVVPIHFCEDVVGPCAYDEVEKLQNGEVLLLENVRKEQRELENDGTFSKTLASFGDVYINDAFSDAHRKHASIVGIPRHIPGYIGPLFERELRGIDPARNPKSPSLAIIGGAKFVTKEPLLHHLVSSYDKVFVGGAIVNDLLKAKGFNVGKSLVSDMANVEGLVDAPNVLLPEYVVVGDDEGGRVEKHVSEVENHEMIYDIGEKALDELQPHIDAAQFILWNGPMGYFEGGYKHATERLANIIADTRAHTIVGGGNTIEAIQRFALHAHFTHASTSGGAMLQYIVDGTLVGLNALTQ